MFFLYVFTFLYLIFRKITIVCSITFTTIKFLSINTNLSRPVIEDFIARVPPDRVHYIHAALQVEERLAREEIGLFLDRAKRLRQAGFFVMCSVVMTPVRIADYPVYEDLFGAQGFALHPKVLRGAHAGKVFPDAYTPEERMLLRRYIARAATFQGAGPWPMGEAPTIDLYTEAGLIEGRRDYSGRLCASGSRFVRIEPDGSVFRCGTTETLGKLLENNLRLLTAPRPCDTSYCPYFCEKYTRPEFLDARVERAEPGFRTPG